MWVRVGEDSTDGGRSDTEPSTPGSRRTTPGGGEETPDGVRCRVRHTRDRDGNPSKWVLDGVSEEDSGCVDAEGGTRGRSSPVLVTGGLTGRWVGEFGL